MNEVIISEIIANSRVFAPIGLGTALLISGGAQLLGGIFGASSSSKRARREGRRKAKLTRELTCFRK